MNGFGGMSRTVLALSLGFLVSGVLSAQSDLGTISGFVKDPSGATVPNAKVTVQNQSGVEREATTNESGYYTITRAMRSKRRSSNRNRPRKRSPPRPSQNPSRNPKS